MTILRNHFLNEFFSLFFTCLAGLVAVFVTGRGLVQMADLVFNKNVDVTLVLRLVLYSLPFLMVFILPMAVLLATLLTFTKLSHDNEVTAMRASGVSITKVTLPLVWIVTIFCLCSFVLSDRIASTSHYAYRLILTRMGLENPSAALEEGTFIKRFKNLVIFIYEIDRNKLKGIRIYQPQEGKPTRTIIAQKGELISIPEENLVMLKLVHGTSDEPDPKDPGKFYKLSFKTYELPLNISSIGNPELPGKKPKDMTIRELRDEIDRLGQEGIKATYPLSAEIHNKIALAFSSLPFLLMGIPLGVTSRRSEKSFSFALSLFLMMIYWTLLIGGKALAQRGLTPPFLSLQFSNFLVGGLGLFLLIRLARR